MRVSPLLVFSLLTEIKDKPLRCLGFMSSQWIVVLFFIKVHKKLTIKGS